jgi:hypothetical protein
MMMLDNRLVCCPRCGQDDFFEEERWDVRGLHRHDDGKTHCTRKKLLGSRYVCRVCGHTSELKDLMNPATFLSKEDILYWMREHGWSWGGPMNKGAVYLHGDWRETVQIENADANQTVRNLAKVLGRRVDDLVEEIKEHSRGS